MPNKLKKLLISASALALLVPLLGDVADAKAATSSTANHYGIPAVAPSPSGNATTVSSAHKNSTGVTNQSVSSGTQTQTSSSSSSSISTSAGSLKDLIDQVYTAPKVEPSAPKSGVTADGIIINGKSYTNAEFEALLNGGYLLDNAPEFSVINGEVVFAQETRVAFALAAPIFFIPGVGQAAAGIGLVVVAGVAVYEGTQLYNKVMSKMSQEQKAKLAASKKTTKPNVSAFKEHTKNARNSTSDKHTAPRPGRSTVKAQQKPGFVKNPNKRSNTGR